MAKHTPTPWELFDCNGVIAIRNPRAQSSKSEIVFWSGFDASHYPKQASANAAFIVKAVNNHDALVNALTELHAQVIGECPSLLNEDSGGDARLSMEINRILDAVSSQKEPS